MNNIKLRSYKQYFPPKSLSIKDTLDVPSKCLYIIFSLRGTENVYTQHQPLITKEILADILKGKRRPDMKYLEDNNFEILNGMEGNQTPKKTVIFVIGGFTYEETRAVYMANKEMPNSNTIIGGTSLINFDAFMEESKIACNH
jgi:hypothetical protein